MKPAISVILLTTLIGTGQGLFIAQFSADAFVVLTILEPLQSENALPATALSLLFLFAGLTASFFHLGRPERAWRVAAMWRTSWLSREVIALPATMVLICVYGLLKYRGDGSVVFVLGNGNPVHIATLVGVFAMLAVFMLYICTAMIYSCLEFLRQWYSPLTALNFTLMGSASGFTLATAVSAATQTGHGDYFLAMAILLTLLALLSRFITLLRNRRLRKPSTLQSAIGIHHPTIRQIAQGAMGGSFNTRAFIHQYGAAVITFSRRYFLIAGFIFPTLLLSFSAANSTALCLLAFGVQFTGLLVERWYFFIEVEHPQNIYYQVIS